MEYALQAEHLYKNYPGFSLEDVSLHLPKGCIMGLIGENGAGKSTTFKALLDLIHLDSGSVTFWGHPLSKNATSLKEDIGVVFDGLSFYETLTPKQIGHIFSAAYKNWDENVSQQIIIPTYCNFTAD